MKVLMENFFENIRDQIPDIEQFYYIQQEQEKEEDELTNATIKKQKG
jgi:glycosylphosphatidylinositol transamidase (GPIT) subunit GPI8